MDLPLDIKRSIILLLRINNIKNLSFVDKSFYSLCCEKNLWLDKFEENNLVIIDDDINTLNQYINEYKKVSYATYTSNYLINMIISKQCSRHTGICLFNKYFSDHYLKKLFKDNHPIFTKIKDIGKKYVDIFFRIKNLEKLSVNFDGHITNDDDNQNDEDIEIDIFNENCDKKCIILLITKILYYYPLITINDINYSLLVISKNEKLDINDEQNIINKRKEYWEECYSKYEDIYF